MALWALGTVLLGASSLAAQERDLGSATCLVLPFANHSGDANLDWIGESFVVALRQALAGSGVTLLNQQERRQALGLVGAPAGVELSQATMIRMADAADAAWLVGGWFDVDDNQLTITGWVVDLQKEHWVQLAVQNGELTQLEQLQNQLGWAVRQQLSPGGSPPTAAMALPLSAYEEYVRAREATSAQRIKDLTVAAQLAPNDARVLLALGQAYLSAKQDDPAAQWLAKVPPDAPQAVAAAFGLGVADYRLGRYAQAAAAFQRLARQWPLPAVVNNLELAQAAADHQPTSKTLDTEFSEDGFLQFVSVVAVAERARTQPLPPAERVQEELQQGQRLQAQGGLEAAAQAYQQAIAQAAPEQKAELAAAHAGLGGIWYARHDRAQAQRELALALALDAGNRQALALQQQLAEPHE